MVEDGPAGRVHVVSLLVYWVERPQNSGELHARTIDIVDQEDAWEYLSNWQLFAARYLRTD
jgi:hypothetical protein